MSKKLFRNTVIYSIGDFVYIAVSGFLLLPFYTRAMSPADFGLFGIINSAMVVITFMVHFGLISTFSRFYFLYKTDQERCNFMGHVILFHILIVIFLVLILLVSKEYILDKVFPMINDGDERYYYYMVAIPIFGFISSLYAIYLRVLEDAKSFLIFQLSQVFIYITFLIGLNIYMQRTLDAVLVALLCGQFIMWVVATLKLQYNFRLKNFIATLKKLVKFCFPVFIGYIMYFMLNRFNVIFLQNYESIENIAIFSFSLQLASGVAVISGAMGKAFQPIIFKQNEKVVLGITLKISRYYKIIMSILIIVLLASADYLIMFFAPESYSGSRTVFHILALGVFVYHFRSVENTIFLYFHKPKYSLYIISFSAVLVVLLSFILVPINGILGSAYAILAGSSLAYILNKLYFNKLKSELKLISDC